MSSAGDSRPRASAGLSPVTLGLASLGSVVATVLVSQFGLAGTILGAALAPVVVTVVAELGRRPVERVARLPSGARAVVTRRPRVRWGLVGLTSAAAFAAAVAFFTVPDLIAGDSVVSDRPTTFFGASGDGSGGAEPSAPTTTAPETTTTAPETTTAPAETAPEAQPPPASEPAEPRLTAPAPAPAPETAPAPSPVAPPEAAP